MEAATLVHRVVLTVVSLHCLIVLFHGLLQVEIMMALEEQFEITLDEDGAAKISTVQEAADLIESQVAANA